MTFQQAVGPRDRDDPVQACEKLYKAAEEALKALAEVLGLPAHQRAKGRCWTSYLYRRAAREASKRLGVNVRKLWRAAWVLHVRGFHEMSMASDDVEMHAEKVRKLVELARGLIEPQK